MEFIADSVSVGGTSWRRAVSETPQSTLHAFYLKTAEVICFGIEAREPDAQAIRELMGIVEVRVRDVGFKGDTGIGGASFGKFDALGHLSGQFRRFTNGWSNDIGLRVVHVFPCFRCELGSSWAPPKFASTIRSIPIFDLSRQPSPYVEIKMQGGKSKLSITKWANAPIATVLGYARILAAEPEGLLAVKNLDGTILEFNRTQDWSNYEDRLLAHASRTKGT